MMAARPTCTCFIGSTFSISLFQHLEELSSELRWEGSWLFDSRIEFLYTSFDIEFIGVNGYLRGFHEGTQDARTKLYAHRGFRKTDDGYEQVFYQVYETRRGTSEAYWLHEPDQTGETRLEKHRRLSIHTITFECYHRYL